MGTQFFDAFSRKHVSAFGLFRGLASDRAWRTGLVRAHVEGDGGVRHVAFFIAAGTGPSDFDEVLARVVANGQVVL